MYIQRITEKGTDKSNQSFTTFPNHTAIAEMNLLKQMQTSTKSESTSTAALKTSKDEHDSFLTAAIMTMCMNGKNPNHNYAIILLILSLII